ncbi:hypothetical protein [Xylella fastidiosa]|uniref:hypothetical protein n=1 Tax=Xylella fastidiosa TaxID=2371 RepID=UPI002156036F|nr:hypothetical protein [Xylella fastidiosa]
MSSEGISGRYFRYGVADIYILLSVNGSNRHTTVVHPGFESFIQGGYFCSYGTDEALLDSFFYLMGQSYLNFSLNEIYVTSHVRLSWV